MFQKGASKVCCKDDEYGESYSRQLRRGFREGGPGRYRAWPGGRGQPRARGGGELDEGHGHVHDAMDEPGHAGGDEQVRQQLDWTGLG
ncbi:hypothetical protein CORC01_08313 [Colletotrichum orchidophilum]|uniref:Uncharacterized protein n=1 Tax=Colletotrichum orchidophilum TaxID=1209926 RepID=A0A1G4B4N0_9PEZI|nr:uncharacterized protein CORC01_08313 [Colletotrichum orchidophilum]OHE96390.1 hypothetical protein CORC01_08313 [Colletotrichum orchidophilum]